MPIISNFPVAGADGKSPYEAAKAQGYTGTEAEFNAALAALRDSPFVPQAGGSMTGELKMGGNKVSGLAAPTADDDAARKADVDKKQDALTGTAGQMVGFDSDGNPVAQDVPATGLTEAEADEKYLKLTGGDLSKEFYVRFVPNEDEDMSYLLLNKDSAFFGVGSSTGTNFIVSGRTAMIQSTDQIRFDASEGMSFMSLDGGITFQNPVSIKPGTADTHAATVAQAVPKVTLVTLSASGWDSSAKTQTVTVSGIDADESKQWIMPTPAAGHKTAYDNAGIQCTAQAADAVTFTASTVPTADIKVWVKVENVNDVTPPS